MCVPLFRTMYYSSRIGGQNCTQFSVPPCVCRYLLCILLCECNPSRYIWIGRGRQVHAEKNTYYCTHSCFASTPSSASVVIVHLRRREKAILFCMQIVLLFVLPFFIMSCHFCMGQNVLQFEWYHFAHSFTFEWGKFGTIHCIVSKY